MSIIIVACPDRSTCNDSWPEALGLAFHHQGPTLFNVKLLTNLVDRN